MSPAEIIAREVRKIVAFELAKRDGGRPIPLHSAVMGAAEKPLLEAVLQYYDRNQTHAAVVLGINRNTLRKKMKAYGIR
jgi:Fis family transcriptional regulator